MRIRMTKEVLVTISGLQFSPETESESVELITSGSYYKKNGKHYIIYDEVNEGFSETTRNIIKLSEVLLRAFAVFHLVRSAEQLGVFGKINGGDKTFVMLAVRRIGGCERGAHHRAPMEGTLECNDCRTLGCILGQLDRALDGFCTGVGEVNLVAAAHQTDNALCKSGLLLIVEQIVAAVHHLIKLLVRRLDNSRIIMAEVVYCDAAAKIQNFAAVIRIQVAAGGMIDTERHLVQRKGRHNSSRTFIQIRHDNFLLNQSSNVWFSQ